MMIVIDNYGVSVNVRNKCFYLRSKEAESQISPFKVSAIHIRKPCDVSTPALLLAAEHQIPFLLFDSRGKVKARVWQPFFGSLAEIRRQQIYWGDGEEGLAWVRKGLQEKIAGQLKLFRWLGNRVPGQKENLAQAALGMRAWQKKLGKEQDWTPASVRAVEAQAGKIYWEAYFDALEKYAEAEKRSRQPARDPLNALLNYGYGMLYAEVETAVLTAGLDPQIGILHREEYRQPAFVFDAIEPFRPWVERLVAGLAVAGTVRKGWFNIEKEKVWLRKEGKKEFIPLWIEMIQTPTAFNQKRIKRKDQIQYAMTQLAQSLLKDEVP